MSKTMGLLGGADGCVLRCLDILKQTQDRASHGVRAKMRNDEFDEIMDRLEKAHEDICRAAQELEREEDG